MILPIYTFGAEVLRQATPELEDNSEALQTLIDDMFETMHNASGVGLAAPQVGRSERVFVVDLKKSLEDEEAIEPAALPGPLVFINPAIKAIDGGEVEYEEGCLSIPEIRENVVRPDTVDIEYLDRTLTPVRLQATGLLARVIQHELDHLDGILFIDRLSTLKRQLLRRRLREMSRGEVTAEYPILTAPEAARRR
ncbi:MAG TPA: peptide deformylase [Rhodothermales bacterium]|nr:peptide deformylase [Rhodothermales bacterium]